MSPTFSAASMAEVTMDYRKSVQRFAAALSKRALHAAPTAMSDGSLRFAVASGGVERFFLRASEAAFDEIPPEVLIDIVAVKLWKDLRRAGFDHPAPGEKFVSGVARVCGVEFWEEMTT